MFPTRRLALDLAIYLGWMAAASAAVGALGGWLVGRRQR